jgi:hypothetical protein
MGHGLKRLRTQNEKQDKYELIIRVIFERRGASFCDITGSVIFA